MSLLPILDRQIRFALVGCGRISANHVEAITRHAERARIVAANTKETLKRSADGLIREFRALTAARKTLEEVALPAARDAVLRSRRGQGRGSASVAVFFRRVAPGERCPLRTKGKQGAPRRLSPDGNDATTDAEPHEGCGRCGAAANEQVGDRTHAVE